MSASTRTFQPIAIICTTARPATHLPDQPTNQSLAKLQTEQSTDSPRDRLAKDPTSLPHECSPSLPRVPSGWEGPNDQPRRDLCLLRQAVAGRRMPSDVTRSLPPHEGSSARPTGAPHLPYPPLLSHLASHLRCGFEQLSLVCGGFGFYVVTCLTMATVFATAFLLVLLNLGFLPPPPPAHLLTSQ